MKEKSYIRFIERSILIDCGQILVGQFIVDIPGEMQEMKQPPFFDNKASGLEVLEAVNLGLQQTMVEQSVIFNFWKKMKEDLARAREKMLQSSLPLVDVIDSDKITIVWILSDILERKPQEISMFMNDLELVRQKEKIAESEFYGSVLETLWGFAYPAPLEGCPLSSTIFH